MAFDRWLRIVSLRWRSLVGRRHAEQDLDDELCDHLETEIERQMAAGLDRKAAERAAVSRLGDLVRIKEACRDARGLRALETAAADVRYALRTLRRAPAFAAVAIATLALGIGANTAVFSLADAILIAPLPFADPSRLVSVTGAYPGGAFAAMRASIQAVDVAAYAEGHSFTLRGSGEPARLEGTLVSAELMPLLGVKPALGRWLAPAEDVFPRDRVVMLSHALWATRFGADPGVIGRFIEIDGVRREIVAVMPASFQFPSARTDLWLPLGLDPRAVPRYWAGDFMPVVGRLRSGMTIARATADVRAFQTRVGSLFPWPMPADWNRDVGVIPLQDAIVGGVRPRLIILAGAVAVVLLIASANVASLSLSRAAARQREIGIRAALGASPARIARQLLTESVVLACVGAAAGLAVGRVALALLVRVLPPDTPRLTDAGLNGHVVILAGVLALATGCGFGLAPAVHAMRIKLRAALAAGGRGGGPSVRRRYRVALTVAQIGCAVMLVVAAGLLVRSLWGLTHLDPGFDASHIITARVSPPSLVCESADRCVAFYREFEARLRALPGVEGAALVNTLPLTGAVAKRSLDVERYTGAPGGTQPLVWLTIVSPPYLRVLNVRLEAGRWLTDVDVTGAPVAMVSESTARRFWPDRDAIGMHVRFVGEREWRTIVGVVADVHAYDLTRSTPEWMSGTLYVPYAVNATLEDGRLPADMGLVLRTTLPPASTAALVRAAAGRADVVVDDVRTMRSTVAQALAAPAATATLLVAMAALAVALGSVGVYGVLSFLVSGQLRDLGIRFALGASRIDVCWLVVREAAAMCAAGIVAGVGGAIALSRWLSSELYGVSATDPATYLVVSLIVAAVTLVASYVPARRAMHADPLVVLRES